MSEAIPEAPRMRVGGDEFTLLREYIEEQCGISIPDDKSYLVETRLAKIVAETGAASFQEFYRKVKTSRDPELRERIVDAMTTNETLWFRDAPFWSAFRSSILPGFASALAASSTRTVRIWSAACSTGQEPYSAAMLIDELCASSSGRPVAPERFDLLATDISPSALRIATAGRYDKISMDRGFDGEWRRFRDEYFDLSASTAEIRPSIRNRVKFRKFNLQDDFGPLGRFDLVLLRNVAIYFSNGFKRNLFEKLARTLLPGGLLVLGSAESLIGYTTKFSLEEHGRALVYRAVG